MPQLIKSNKNSTLLNGLLFAKNLNQGTFEIQDKYGLNFLFSFTILRLYGPLEPRFKRESKPGNIELID